MQHFFINDHEAEYLKGQIGGACPDRAKRALQEVCLQYSKGAHFKAPVCADVEIATVGQLETNIFEPKVRRWCLNVLALIGTAHASKRVVERVIENCHDDPDTMASALTAYFKVCHTAYKDLKGRSYIGAEQITIAAHIGNFGARIRSDTTTIDIERANAPILRSALVAVGLQRAPEHLFHPRFENAELVRKLSQHDDIDVTQYAVWAINEHPKLTVKHLGFDVTDVQGYTPNIRGWTYRLYGEAKIDDGIRHEVVVEGSRDIEAEARLNMARGLRQTWYDDLESVMCSWFHDEGEADIREEIIEHMVRQSGLCSEYRRLSLEIFDAEDRANQLSKRMLSASAGTPIYGEFRKIEYNRERDLFGSSTTGHEEGNSVTNNTYNIGSVQGGAVSFGGDAAQSGSNSNALTGDQINQLRQELQSFADELQRLESQSTEIKEVVQAVDAAAADPEPSKLAKARSGINRLFSGSAELAKFGDNACKLMDMAKKLSDMLAKSWHT